ncbi:MAG: hypothetical protein GX259_09985 [Bacteroidales bacterium]|nr:hypothetical protein [Bacteroidales bacterium]
MKKIFLITVIAFFATAQSASFAQCQNHGKQGEAKKCSLNLTDEQIKKIEPLKLDFNKKKLDILNQIKIKNAQIQAVTTGSNINKEEALKLNEELYKLKAKLSNERLEHRLKVREILTPEQQLIFDQRSVMNRKTHVGHHEMKASCCKENQGIMRKEGCKNTK